MASSSRIYQINLGSPTVTEDTTVLLGTGSSGTVGAKRVLVHPDAVNFPPITYYLNPHRSINLDNTVLPSPLVEAVRTAGTTQLSRSEREVDDVVITEIWQATPQRASMPTFLFRLLYEYHLNPPPFNTDPAQQTYITWSPRDRALTAGGDPRVFNIETVSLTVGGGGVNQEFDVRDIRAEGDVIKSAFDDLDATPSGVLDRTVTFRFRIVSEVTT